MPVVEVRCPLGPQRLFTKLRLGEETARMVQPGNLLEFSCSDCSRATSRVNRRRLQVFHRYNFLGDLVSTLTQEREPAGPSDVTT